MQRLDTIEQLSGDKMAELAETIDLRRAGNVDAALTIVRSDRGRDAMNGVRSLIADMQTDERRQIDERQRDWQNAAEFSSLVTWSGSGLLLFLIATAAVMSSQDHRAFGFLQPTISSDRELLDRVSEAFVGAVRSANDRTRLEELLGATQTQAEELQAQQEELRVSNEELEEQASALTQSQALLEGQQTKLQQTNAQLRRQLERRASQIRADDSVFRQ